MDIDSCPVCGGDGRIMTSSSTTGCPGCKGSGRRNTNTGFHDVTKTKPSHHHPGKEEKAAKKTEPETAQGRLLAIEVRKTSLPDKEKVKLVRSILDYENAKGEVTKTFTRLLRKQLRALGV